MAVNKVEYGDTTLIDLTSDTVTKETLLIGATAHTASGESISGEFDPEIYLRKSGGDTTNNIVTFTSGDSPSPTAWTNVDSLVTGEKHSSLLNKISTMIKNVRFLYKVLGTTDISTIGDGTVTGAVSTLNSSLNDKLTYIDVTFTDDILIGSKGYADVIKYRPGIDGYTIYNANVLTWASGGTPYGINCTGQWLFGQSGTSITGLKIRYYFIKNK